MRYQSTNQRHSKEDKLRIVEEFLSGGDLLEIAAKNRVTPVSIHSWSKHFGGSIKRRPSIKFISPGDPELMGNSIEKSPMDGDIIQEIRQELKRGTGVDDIAYAYEISVALVRSINREMPPEPAPQTPEVKAFTQVLEESVADTTKMRIIEKPITIKKVEPQEMIQSPNLINGKLEEDNEKLKAEIKRLREIIGRQAIEIMELKDRD